MSDEYHTNILAISHNPKGIPYHGGTREGGSTNHGFKNPKIMTREELLAIPEVIGDEAFEYVIPNLNHGKTGYFTVGCEKSHNTHQVDEKTKYWVKGYVEFAFNHRQMIEDASYYFPLFFKFSEHVRKLKVAKDHCYLWELAGNHLHDASLGLDQGGFSATVWLRTELLDDADTARDVWVKAWKLLTDFMLNWTGTVSNETPFIYPSKFNNDA